MRSLGCGALEVSTVDIEGEADAVVLHGYGALRFEGVWAAGWRKAVERDAGGGRFGFLHISHYYNTSFALTYAIQLVPFASENIESTDDLGSNTFLGAPGRHSIFWDEVVCIVSNEVFVLSTNTSFPLFILAAFHC